MMMLSPPAAKGFEFGSGFGGTGLRASDGCRHGDECRRHAGDSAAAPQAQREPLLPLAGGPSHLLVSSGPQPWIAMKTPKKRRLAMNHDYIVHQISNKISKHLIKITL